MNFFLIGMMGSGKSTLGKLLSAQWKKEFIDLDAYIAHKEGSSISTIFQSKGETYFRELESKALSEVIAIHKDVIVACGGGLPAYKNNLENCLKHGAVVYLESSPRDLYNRVKNDVTRPLVKDYTSFKALFEEREIYYKQATICVNANRSISEVLEEILGHFSF